MANPKMIPNYVTGIRAAKAKMVARVGQAEADKWERNAINSAARYEQAYTASQPGRMES